MLKFNGRAKEIVSQVVQFAGRWVPVLGGAALLVGCKGRPFELDGRRYEAESVNRSDWLFELQPDLKALNQPLRDRLRDHWLEAARAEHGSIAAFSTLSLQLIAVGAPPSLIERTHRAALDEIKHARLCYSLASTYGDEEFGPDRLPEARLGGSGTIGSRAEELYTLALDSLLNGALNEGMAAREAKMAASRVKEGVLQKVWETIARDEHTHGELGWSIVEWCVEQSESELLPQLLRRLNDLERVYTENEKNLEVNELERSCGLLTLKEQQELFELVREELLGRLILLEQSLPQVLSPLVS